MSIIFDAASSGNISTSATCTVAHTCSATLSSRFLYVATLVDGSKTISGVTYGGVSMTECTGSGNVFSSSWTVQLFRLVNPKTGANNIIATANSGTPNIWVRGASYANVLQASSSDNEAGGGNDGVASQTLAVTTTVNNDWMVGANAVTNANTTAASTNMTARSGDATPLVLGDRGPLTPAGAFTMTASQNASVAGRWAASSIKPSLDSAYFLPFF